MNTRRMHRISDYGPDKLDKILDKIEKDEYGPEVVDDVMYLLVLIAQYEDALGEAEGAGQEMMAVLLEDGLMDTDWDYED